ncbi:MAG: TonB-dependent receptor [Gammaproteobacteria bacterium]
MKKILLSCLVVTASAGLNAQTIEEIVVTADLRKESTMNVAASVSVVSDAVIADRAAEHFEDVINAIPNVNFASGSNRARFFQIRGIGERSQFINPINPSVGVLIDDVDFSGAATVATMTDVSQVEVLRGPQGTRYGANALAGLINIKTNDATAAPTLRLRLSSGDYGHRVLGLIAGGALSDAVNARLVIASSESDGYIDNDFLGRDDTNNRDELTLRGKLNWQTNDWKIGLTAARVDIDNGYDAFSLDNTRQTLSDEPGFDAQESTYFALKATRELSAGTLELRANHASSDIAYGYDEDWSFTGIHPWGYTSTDHYFRDRDTLSLEARVISGPDARILSDSTDWVIGVYSLQSEESLTRDYTYAAGPFDSEYNFDTLAIFGQFDTALSDRLVLSTGLRFERRETDYNDSALVRFSPKDSLWGGKIALEYITSTGALLYGSVSRGYKAGGFNTDGSLDTDLREFDEEYLVELELGYKATMLDDSLALQLALFHDDRHDQQVKSSVVRVRPDGSAEFIDFLGNAAEGTNKGLELDVRWQASEAVSLGFAAGWLDASFDEFINEFGEDLSGRDQAHAPGHMLSVNAAWEDGPWRISLSADNKDEFYFSDRHAVKSDSYTLVNAAVSYSAASWQLTAWGRNLTDKDTYVRAFGSFGNDPRKFYVTEPYFQYGEPRVVGVTLEFSFGDS